MFDDMTWQARIGEFTVPDFVPDETIALEESEGFRSAKNADCWCSPEALLRVVQRREPFFDYDPIYV